MSGFITTHDALARIAERIRPADIPFLTHLPCGVGKFGAMETELNAGGIVRFFRNEEPGSRLRSLTSKHSTGGRPIQSRP